MNYLTQLKQPHLPDVLWTIAIALLTATAAVYLVQVSFTFNQVFWLVFGFWLVADIGYSYKRVGILGPVAGVNTGLFLIVLTGNA